MNSKRTRTSERAKRNRWMDVAAQTNVLCCVSVCECLSFISRVRAFDMSGECVCTRVELLAAHHLRAAYPARAYCRCADTLIIHLRTRCVAAGWRGWEEEGVFFHILLHTNTHILQHVDIQPNRSHSVA